MTLALALLLGIGFMAAKIAQFFRLPSVTGYICAGLLLGPCGFAVITGEVIEGRLSHFTQMALMLIAFGIGEHLEFKKLRRYAKSIVVIALCEGVGAFVLVAIGVFAFFFLSRANLTGWGLLESVAAALMLGAVSVATAPASTLHVVREIGAHGPLTTTLLQVVAINNGMAVMLFGAFLSIAAHLLGAEASLDMTSLAGILGGSLLEISASLGMGVLTGLLIDFSVNRLQQRHEMLTAGLALLLVCGEVARLFHLSPLLAGMATGCTIVNRDFRDVRLFRTLNTFEPPIYVLFFTLAGAHLDLSSLATAGSMGIIYFLFRAMGKGGGAYCGAFLSGAPRVVRNHIGFALIPQAGVAIGLVFLLQEAAGLEKLTSFISTVVLAGVFLSELVGPVCTRLTLARAGEAVNESTTPKVVVSADRDHCPLPHTENALTLVPWTWEKLLPRSIANGSVVFGVSHEGTVAGLTRMTAIFANYYQALAVAVRVMPLAVAEQQPGLSTTTQHLFALAMEEAFSLGYPLETTTIQSSDIADGILNAAINLNQPWGIILGHPMTKGAQEFQKIVESVAARAPCPVIVVRFSGILHTERILVPLWQMRELESLRDLVSALSSVGKHQISLFYLMPPESSATEQDKAREKLSARAARMGIPSTVQCLVTAAEARSETIIQEAQFHDLVIMNAGEPQGVKRFFFGSLAERVAAECGRTTMLVRAPRPMVSK